MKFIPGTLRARLALLIILAAVPGLFVLLAFVWMEQSRVTQETEQRALTAIEVLAVNQRDLILRTKGFLERLSSFSEVRDPADPACSRFLQQVLKLSAAYVNLGVPLPNGELRCNALPMTGAVNVADRSYFQRTLRTKGFTVGEFQVDRAAKQASLNFSYPVIEPESGEVRGVAVAVVSLDWWSRKLGEAELPDGAVAVVTDANGTIVAHYPPNSRALGLFAETYGFEAHPYQRGGRGVRLGESGPDNSQAMVYAHHALFPYSLSVSVGLPYGDLLATSRGYLWLGIGIILFGVALMLILMLWTARVSVLTPLAGLLSYTRSLEIGSAPEAPAPQGALELRTLQAQIVSMGRTRLDAESELRRSEARFRQIAEAIQEVFWIVSPDWNQVVYVNPAYEHVWQKSVESLYREPHSWLDSVVPEDRQKVFEYIKRVNSIGVSDIQFPTYRIERRDGTLRWISAKGFPVRDESGDITTIVGIAEDVTERIQYEAELSEREAKYRLLVEHAEDLVVKVDTEGRFLFVSPSYCHTFGKSEHQLLGKAFMPLVHEDDQATTTEAMKALYYPPFRAYLEQRAMTMRGWRWFGWSDTSVVDDNGKVTEIIGVGRDITDQKRVEFALRESESRYRELVDNMSDGVVVYQRARESGDFIIKELNRAAEKITQNKKELIVGRRAIDIFPGITRLGLLDVFAQVAETGEPMHHPARQYQDQRLDIWVENYVFRIPSGEVVAVFKDMTAEKRAMLALQNSEGKFRGFFESLPVGLVMADVEGKVIEVNKSFSDILGIGRSEAVGRSLLELLAPTSERIGFDRLDDVLIGRDEQCSFRFSYLTRDNRQVTADVSVGVLLDNSGARIFIYGIIEDVTALVEAEETRSTLQRELMRTHRLEALGRLAGGIAHDFNNILGAISGFIELARRRLESAEPQQIREYLQYSEESTERAKLLIRQLLLFSRGPEVLMAAPHDFSEVVNDSLGMIRSFLPSTISFEVTREEGSHWVKCDPAQIEQILVNLCINARDAMEGQGAIHVRVSGYDASGDHCEICSKPVMGRWVSLSIEDTGPGMPEEVRERIFEPFFTTKEGEQGSGLGLAVVRGIVSSYGGHVLISTGKRGGTCFRILFPYHRKEQGPLPTERSTERERISRARLRGVSVMVVDDEASMRQLFREVLADAGCRVIECEDGETALKQLGDGEVNVDLLVTDQTMPHFTGIDLVRKLRERGNSLPVILCSGFSEQITERSLQELEIAHCLDKPIKIHDLLAAIGATLSDAKKQA